MLLDLNATNGFTAAQLLNAAIAARDAAGCSSFRGRRIVNSSSTACDALNLAVSAAQVAVEAAVDGASSAATAATSVVAVVAGVAATFII
jgi:hypothetical protein